MAQAMTVNAQALNFGLGATTVAFVSDALQLPERLEAMPSLAGAVKRLFGIESYKAKAQSVLVATGLSELPGERLVIVGLGKIDAKLATEDLGKIDWVTLGGIIGSKLAGGAISIIGAFGSATLSANQMADLGLGLQLRAYRFDRYKTKKKDEDQTTTSKINLLCADVAGARKALKTRQAITDGVNIARELVNEPPNVLNPVTFAKRAAELKEIGVEVKILGEKELTKLGMRALLAVGQGSRNESQVVIMRWNGASDAKARPVAFVGKGVTFDTGGISIKPAGGMEDMKGDMAGAACVTGLMHTLAARKAKVNAIGIIGLVENMPDGNAQRPGDIVTSMSGQTIEIINTDAEGRLVLADVLWHTQSAFKPQFMVNLATLTGAIMVALGQEYAGLFSNNDALSERLFAAGKATGERVWRMPLDPAYDKIIDSKFADVKNSGGRFGGSITAAQFLQRFVNECPWAHLDIAGTGMSAPQTETNRSWGSGWGVRMLNQMVADHYEN